MIDEVWKTMRSAPRDGTEFIGWDVNEFELTSPVSYEVSTEGFSDRDGDYQAICAWRPYVKVAPPSKELLARSQKEFEEDDK